MTDEAFETTDRGDGVTLATYRISGAAPTFVWFSGYRSDMAGTKAQALGDWAQGRGQAFLAFDYSGHGRSGGRFEDGTIGVWLADALAAIAAGARGRLVLVGSSMGAWIALLAARALGEAVCGLILIAPAADFTERLMWPAFSEAEKAALLAEGRLEQASAYEAAPNVITRALIEDGRRRLVMDAPIAFAGPVHILQGKNDPDVPWTHAAALARNFSGATVRFQLIEDGDHRLSRPEDIARLIAAAEAMADALA